MKQKALFSSLLVLAGAVSYGFLPAFVKFAYEEGYSLGEITGSQMFFGFLLMWGIVFFHRALGKKKHGMKTPLTREKVLKCIALGSCAGLTGILYYGALRYLPASVGIVLLFQFSWIGVLMEAALVKKRPAPEQLAALALLVGGTLLAAEVWTAKFSGFSWLGVLLGFLSAFTYAVFLLGSGRVAVEVSPWLRSAWIVTGSMLSVFLVFPPRFLLTGALTESLAVWAFLLALFGAVIPTVCFALGAPHIQGGLVAILGSAELPMAVLVSWVVLRESVSWLQWAGVLLILLGIAFAETGWQRKRKACEP
ncbi:DMT family transporter [Bacillaceae bacterium]